MALQTVSMYQLFFFSTFAECKLSRSGPPATIVAIDEESPNGKVFIFTYLLFILYFMTNVLSCSSTSDTTQHFVGI